MFIFGHSLLDHRPPLNPTPSDETTVPHWLHLLAVADGNHVAVGGQYGFLPQHANVPPISQWGYDVVPSVWESDYEPFSDANINTILITAGNFVQYQGPAEDYYGMPGLSPVSATETIMDWCVVNSDSATIFLYENWPDLAGFLNSGFPGTTTEFENYNQYLEGDFHNWWIEYQDLLLASRPDINVRMIPVGPIISGLLSDVLNDQLVMADLYEDDAPHGLPNIYFLAGLITYMSVYEKEAPSNFTIPALIHPDIASSYTDISNYIWNALLSFNDAQGSSRVFSSDPVSNVVLENNNICLLPNPNEGVFKITGLTSEYLISVCDINGSEVFNHFASTDAISLNMSTFPDSIYFVKIINQNNGQVLLEKMIKY